MGPVIAAVSGVVLVGRPPDAPKSLKEHPWAMVGTVTLETPLAPGDLSEMATQLGATSVAPTESVDLPAVNEILSPSGQAMLTGPRGL